MRVSRYIPKLALGNIKKKKNRSLLSFISVMLSSCIIFVSLTLFTTIFTLSKSLNQDALGTAHYYLVSDHFDNNDIHMYQASYYSINPQEDIAYFYQDENASFFSLEKGKLPSSHQEILARSGQQYQIGDKISQYTICGLYTPTTFFEENVDAFPLLSIDERFKAQLNHYFIHDQRIQDEASIETVANYAGVEMNEIYLNSDRITNDTITNYLQDTSTILGMFMVIIFIAVVMCLVSIYNVLIVNDEDRRKEIGLLKSIGITSLELKWMIILELGIIGLVGGLVGILIGIGICSGVLYSVLDELKIIFNMHYVLRPMVILISLVCGILMMVTSGYILYHHYFTSTPISDLKSEPVQYDIPYDPQRFSISSVPWQMFVIYNERIKKQTRNLRRSFLLVMLTVTLFSGIWFSNFLYQQNYNQVKTDFGISQTDFRLGNRQLYPELENCIYEMAVDDETKLSKVELNRTLIGLKILAPLSSFTDQYIRSEGNSLSIKEIDGEKWSNAFHNGIILDQTQLQELAPYVIAGDITKLNENSTVLIYNQYGYYTSSTPVRKASVGYQIMCENINQSKPMPPQFFNVDAVIELPYKKMDFQYSSVDEYLFTIAFTKESFEQILSNELTLRYEGKLEMENPSNHLQIASQLKEAMMNLNIAENLKITDYIQVKSDGSFAVFLIEVLLYPLFMMLVVIGIININNVLKGNIHMKRTDFSTMKSVGMTSYQLRMIMIYEYAENYLNAGAITFLLCIPVYVLENYIKIASTFKVGDNFAGMFVMSFAIISPVIIFSLAAVSFKHLKKITALDGMKDIT